ncbi:hypothetical protein Adt_10245 [Abeliophyllum distichum]|uniref:Uncharacterized protein n=1 Tax=Abeliophyllum distichum TaxID=126358 RepID=A0ABD1UJG3_9LAMI
MSKYLQRELNSTNSQVLGSLLPSEPPDIGNWFSSYVYESPELNNRDGFEDCDGPESRRNYTANGKKDELTENGFVGKCNHVGEKGSSNGFTKCNGPEDSASEVLEPLDSVSLPSELPGIQNWFSSYVYESPELNTLDGFKDCDVSRGNDIAKDKDSNLSENGLTGKWNHAFIAGEKGSSYGFTKRNDPHGFADFKSAAEVSGFSDTLTFSSEPPDIKNWFSSYVYESPPKIDTNFMVSDYEESEVNGKVHVAQIGNSKIEDKTRDFTEAGKSSDLLNQRRISAAIVECNSLVKDERHENQHISEHRREAAGKLSLSVMNDLTSGRIPKETSQPQRQQNHNQGLMEESRKSKDDGDYSGKPDCQSLDTKINSENQDGKSLHKLIEKEDCAEISLEEKHLQVNGESIQPQCTSSLTIPKEKSTKKLAGRRNEKENIEGTEFAENGFISTRKSRSREVNSENIERPHRIQPESLRSGVTFSSIRNEDAKTTRKVLCESTNFQQYPNAIESRGKWHCPQKSKPELGPPLKQLRLEQWIRPG